MADPITLSDEIVRTAQTASVYLKQYWWETWTEQPYLYCDSASWVASPSISTAQLSWTYGRAVRQGETTVGTVTPLSIDGWWVKVVFDQGDAADLLWYGFVDENTRHMDGDLLVSGARVATGHQTLLCRGMEALLDRHTIRTAWCAHSTGEYRVLRGLEFNTPNRSDDAGNKSAAIGPQGVYLFAEDLGTAGKWASRHIIDHLLEYHTPRDSDGDKVVQFKLHNDAFFYLPNWDTPRLATHGRTLKHLLDAIMDRRRGLSYVVEVEDGTEEVVIRPFTFLDSDVFVSGGHVLNASQSQKTIDFQQTPDVASARLRSTGGRTYGQVVAFGQQIIVCETIREGVSGEIVAHWDTGTLQTAYNAGASGEGDYPAAANRTERRQRNIEFRSAEKFSRVYSHFGPSDTWRSAAANDNTLCADVGLDLSTDYLFYYPTQRFERTLPLKTDHYYAQSHAGGLTLIDVTDLTPSGKSWEYLRPIVAMTLHDDLPSTSGKWAKVDKLPVAAGVEGTGDGHGRTFGCSVRMQNDALGFVLKVHGAPQWAIAKTDFAAPDNSDLGGTYHPIGDYDWKDDLAATVASKADCFVSASYPETITGQIDAVRTLYLDASAKAGLEVVCDNTMLDVQDGDRIESGSSTYYIRDDREMLEQIARIAHEWYAVTRQTLAVTWNQIENAGLFSVGDLITTIGADETEEEIRTAITSIRVVMAQSAQQQNRLTIETQWADLDLAGIY
ncbi:MAG: hypothetical protein ACYSWU_01915 [Planctomycetota bacterium]